VEFLSTVYRKDISRQEESYTINSPKEKKMVSLKSMLKFPFLNSFVQCFEKLKIKQGLFGKVMKDLKGGKVKNNDEFGTEHSSSWDLEQLSSILEATNFPVVEERRNSSEKEEVELSVGNFFFFFG
jgi:hypothetical protein